MNHDFLIPIVDTDSLTICKKNKELFCKEEVDTLTEEINSLTPELIRWEFEFNISKIIVLKSKNYILYDGKKIKTKGSSLRDQKCEVALREMIDTMIAILVNGESHHKLTDIYHQYIKEAMNIKNIKRWSSKKTLTEKTESSTRANETKLKDAVKGSEYRQADKVWVFFKNDDTLCLAENFDSVDYNKKRLLEKLFKKTQVFKSVLDTKNLFINYSLKRNEKLLENL